MTVFVQWYYNANVPAVKSSRTRRSELAEATRRRVVSAASRLFVEHGYSATTIEAVANAANVSVETVYKRFGSKRALLAAAIDLAVVEMPQPDDFVAKFMTLPRVQAIRAETNQRAQIQMLAALSSTRLERSASLHRMLRAAVAADIELSDLLKTDHELRRASQRALIDLLLINGRLRQGLTPDEAAETYSALANPDLYLLLITHHRWTPDGYQSWLADTLERLLLPQMPEISD